jgi:hypothetical protein
MVQGGAVVDVADVHAGTLSDRLETLEHGDAFGVVAVVAGCGGRSRF